MTDRQKQLLNDKPSVLFFKLSVPGVIGMLVFGFYQFIDGVFVGQFVGPAGMGAVGLIYPFSLLNNGISGLIGIGASSVVSRAIGRGDNEILERIFPVVFMLNLIICAVVTVFSIIYAPQVVSFMGGEGEMLTLGVQYMRIVIAGTFFINFAASTNLLIRSEGMIREAMIILGVGAVLNLILDPLFMLVFDMGIRGAAAATVLAQMVSMLTSVLFLRSEKSIISVSFNLKHISADIVKRILRIGFSGFALPLMAIVEIVTAYKMLDLFAGISDVIALGTIFKIFSLLLPPAWGIAQGMQPFVGVNYGAGRIKRMFSGYRLFTFYASIFTLIFWSVLMFAPRFVTGLFVTDPIILEQIYHAPRIFFCMYPLYGFMFNTLVLLQATGSARQAAVFVSCRMVLFFIPVMLIVCPFYGAIGVWIANPIADILTSASAAMALVRFNSRLKPDPEYV
ncbi:MAG: MATE family efflux transporter [Spirochaetales bacterium]|uniref:Multidrug export protein MepA n=1 Tax=Candidatus Thalassospirochaeta sargassi TaxID=3119039 RepID=A0AAJ1IEH2_9SPIO|nr:MATE family efflux transporter [Spirochaetales bacterium]